MAEVEELADTFDGEQIVDGAASDAELPSDRVADLVEYLVTSLVEDVDSISIDVTDGEESSLIEVHVSEGDVGRVIGRHGKVIKSIRSLARACGSRLGISVEVEVVD